MTNATAADPANHSFYRPGGFLDYDPRDLAYSDRKVREAVKMADPEAQREHLREVVEMYVSKYGAEISVECLLEHSNLDSVYVQKMLIEEREDTAWRARMGYKTSYSLEEVKEHIRARYGNEIFD